MKEKKENTVEEAKMKQAANQKAAQEKMLMGVGSSFITELRTNVAFRGAVQKSPELLKRIEMLGLNMKSLVK